MFCLGTGLSLGVFCVLCPHKIHCECIISYLSKHLNLNLIYNQLWHRWLCIYSAKNLSQKSVTHCRRESFHSSVWNIFKTGGWIKEYLCTDIKSSMTHLQVLQGPVSERVIKLRLIASCTQCAIELRWISIVRLIATHCETGPRSPWNFFCRWFLTLDECSDSFRIQHLPAEKKRKKNVIQIFLFMIFFACSRLSLML